MERSALLVIDMQNRFREMAIAGNIVENILLLVEHFKKTGGHVVYTQHHDVPGSSSKLLTWWKEPIIKGSHDWKLMDDLHSLVEPAKDIVLTEKTRYDAFLFTPLHGKLKERNIEKVFVVGCMTNLCCESTARAAFMHDYDVTFVNDGNATSNPKMHAASVLNLGFGFAKIVRTADVLKS